MNNIERAYFDWQALQSEWSKYMDYLRETCPPEDGKPFELKCPHHQRIDAILFPPAKDFSGLETHRMRCEKRKS